MRSDETRTGKVSEEREELVVDAVSREAVSANNREKYREKFDFLRKNRRPVCRKPIFYGAFDAFCHSKITGNMFGHNRETHHRKQGKTNGKVPPLDEWQHPQHNPKVLYSGRRRLD